MVENRVLGIFFNVFQLAESIVATFRAMRDDIRLKYGQQRVFRVVFIVFPSNPMELLSLPDNIIYYCRQ